MIKDERGMTIAELLVFLAIAGLITGTLVTAIYQIFHVTGWGSNQMRVQHDLQNAATWLNRDVVSALYANPNSTGSQIVLTVPYFITGTRTITYTYFPTKEDLVRISSGSRLTVAKHIIINPFPPTTDTITSTITITLTSRAGNTTESATLYLDMRPESTSSP